MINTHTCHNISELFVLTNEVVLLIYRPVVSVVRLRTEVEVVPGQVVLWVTASPEVLTHVFLGLAPHPPAL